MLSRRELILAGTLLTSASAAGMQVAVPRGAEAKSRFVAVDGQRFVLNGETYRYVGTNMWYGAYLGAPD